MSSTEMSPLAPADQQGRRSTAELPSEVLVVCGLMLVASLVLVWPVIRDMFDAVNAIHSPEHFETKAGRHIAAGLKKRDLLSRAAVLEHQFSFAFGKSSGQANSAHMRLDGALGVAYAAVLAVAAIMGTLLVRGVYAAEPIARRVAQCFFPALALSIFAGRSDLFTDLIRDGAGHHDFQGPTDLRLVAVAVLALGATFGLFVFPQAKAHFDRRSNDPYYAFPSLPAAQLLAVPWSVLTLGIGTAYLGLPNLATRFTVCGGILAVIGLAGLIVSPRLSAGRPVDRLVISTAAVANVVVLFVLEERQPSLLLLAGLVVGVVVLCWLPSDSRAVIAEASQLHPLPSWMTGADRGASAAYDPPLAQPTSFSPPPPARPSGP
jgi:hypothetical protein